MSNSNRPFGNNHSSDFHDPHQDARTDAPPSDADALDAWLNGIASHSGSSGTRSGNGRRRPNARIDDHNATGDTASVIETAARFHRRIDEAQSRDARAAEPDPQLWETIMERTSRPASKSVSTAEATANPWVAQPDTRQSPPQRPERRSRPRISNQQRIWNTVANIGLVIAILLAGFGVWRLSGEPGLPSGSNGDSPTVPGFAMQASPPAETPTTSEPDEVIVPPVSTPTPTTACDFSEDIPIFNGVDESPWDGTAVLQTTTGEVMLTCPEESEGRVLMRTSPHGSIGSLEWPGVVLIPSYGEKPEEARTRVLSLVTGEIVEFGFPAGNVQLGTQGAENSPWLIGPAPNDTSDVQILNLRTMRTRLLSEIAGVPLPEIGNYLTSGNGAGGTMVFGPQSHNTSDGNGTLITDSSLPGDLLVLNGNLDTASWISVPEDFPPVTEITVSPDGAHVALHGVTDQVSRDREDMFSVIRTRDGKEIERSSVVNDGPETSEGVWVQRGQAFAFINDNKLMILPLLSDMPEQAVFEGEGPLARLRATTDPNTVLVNAQWADDLATMVANGAEPILYSVETGSRAVNTFTGVDVSVNTDPWPYPHRFLVTFDPVEERGDTITYQVIDAVTGEAIGTLDDVPLNDQSYPDYPHLGPSSVASSPDGNTEIIAFDSQHTYLMRVVDGQYQIEHLPAPGGTLAQTPLMLSLEFSPDGTLVWMSGQGNDAGYLLDLTAEELTWQPIPSTGNGSAYIPFVPGSGIIGERPDWTADIEAGYDFSNAPDGTKVLTSEQFAKSLREAEDNFYWPSVYDPDVEAMIDRGLGPEDSLYKDGSAYTMLGGYNKCAWNQVWLDAFESGDDATARKALWIMTEIFPTFPNLHWSAIKWQIEAATLAAAGDPTMVQQSVTVNCQNMLWE